MQPPPRPLEEDLMADLANLAPYREFVDTAPKKVANRFRKAVQAETSELKT
jgi:hypothetical protein